MLDDFSAVKVDSTKPADAPQPAATQPTADATKSDPSSVPQPNVDDAFSEEDFAKQLQAGMADLLGELEKSVRPDATVHNRKLC